MQSAGNFAASSLSRLPVPFIKGKWPKARGDRDRWHGKAVTDEGAGFGLRLLCAGEFRRLRAASDFAHGGKVTKTPPGTAPDEHFVLIVAFPRTPFTGATPSAWQKISGAQNQECLSAIPSGPTGGLSLQNLEHLRFKICAWLCRTNAPGAFPP